MMYTLDGLWYNVCFLDVIAFIAAVLWIVIGLFRVIKRKVNFETKAFLATGILGRLVLGWMGVRDRRSIQQRDFIKVRGVFDSYHRESRGMAPFTFGYVFSTGKPEKQTFYLDSFTKKGIWGLSLSFAWAQNMRLYTTQHPKYSSE